jgi:hypothetical protein
MAVHPKISPQFRHVLSCSDIVQARYSGSRPTLNGIPAQLPDSEAVGERGAMANMAPSVTLFAVYSLKIRDQTRAA